MGVFVVSGRDASELFEFVEETLDQVALSLEPLGEREGLLPVAFLPTF